MLSEKSISSIAAMLKVSPSDLKEKISSQGEEDINLPDLKVFTPEDLETRIRNEKATSYQEGKVAQEEMLVKNAKKDLGYDFEGKSFDAFLDHHSKSIADKYSKDGSTRVKELESDIEKLNSNHKEALASLQSERESLSGQILKMRVSNELLASMPAETAIDKADILTLFNSRHQIMEQEGKLIVQRDGTTLKDETTAAPLPVKDVFQQYLTEKNYVKGTPGRGTGNETGGSPGYNGNSISDFNSRWTKTGKSLNSPEYDKAYSEWRSEHKEVVQ